MLFGVENLFAVASGAVADGRPWVAVHVVLMILGYGFFAAQAVNAGIFLLQDYGLRHRFFKGVFRFLPSLRQLDQISAQLLAGGVMFSAAGFAAGFADDVTVAPAKLAAGIFVWAAYAALLFFRKKGKLSGARFARVSIILFAVALLAFWPTHVAVF